MKYHWKEFVGAVYGDGRTFESGRCVASVLDTYRDLRQQCQNGGKPTLCSVHAKCDRVHYPENRA